MSGEQPTRSQLTVRAAPRLTPEEWRWRMRKASVSEQAAAMLVRIEGRHPREQMDIMVEALMALHSVRNNLDK